MCELGRAGARRHLPQLRARPQGRPARGRGPREPPGRSPAAPRSPRPPRPVPHDRPPRHSSSALFRVGAMLMAIGFAAHVGHAVMLANGRRTVPALMPSQQPAYAGVVTGSFVTEPGARRLGRAGHARLAEPPLAAGDRASRSSPGSPSGRRCWRARSSSGAGRGATCSSSPSRSRSRWSAATCSSQRRYPIRSIGFIPTGVALALLLYASSLPSEIEPLVPGAPERAAADDPRRHGGHRVRDLRDELRGRRRRTSSRARRDRFAWLPSHKVLDEVAYRAVDHRLPDLRDDDHPRARGGRRSPGRATGAGTPRRPRRSSRG